MRADFRINIVFGCIIMDNFDIVLALGRIALEADAVRATHQLERLRDALKDVDKDRAAKVSRLLSRGGRRQALSPMAFDEMRATAKAARSQLPGEILTPTTQPPRDKETGAPLASIIFPAETVIDPPIFGEELMAALDDLLSEWQQADKLARIGAKPNTRCLIFGQPGVGKTRLAHHIAARLDLPCIEARLDGLVSSFLGTSARNIGALFDFANRYQCVLFLDEFDAIAKARDDAQEIGEIKRVVNSLLQSIDRRSGRGFTLAATNHEHLLDPAVWRRFEIRIQLPPPDEETRSKLLVRFAAPLGLQDAEKRFLTWLTEGMSGAEIETLVAAIKRFLVLHGTTQPDARPTRDTTARAQILLDATRRQAVLNARLFRPDRSEVLAGDPTSLAGAMKDAGFTQREIGDFLGLSQSAVSRRQKPRMADEEMQP